MALVAGRGTTGERSDYAARVSGLAQGRVAVRLVQRDMDGAATVTASVEVEVPGRRPLAYPSPARAWVRVAGLRAPADVVDALGRVVARVLPDEALDVSSWPPGLCAVVTGLHSAPFTVLR